MKPSLGPFVCSLLLAQSSLLASSFNLPDELTKEKYDEEAYERMFPDDEILLSRRRQDLDADEDFFEDSDSRGSSMSSATFTSNMDDVKNVVTLNGIDISKLPANYHNTTTIKRKIGNKTISVNVTINKITDPATGATSISMVETSNTNGVGLKECTSSKSCETGKFCRNLYYGKFCSKCKSIEESCYINEECCGNGTEGALCVSGKCKTGFKQGQAGTICKTKRDCNSGMCCARRSILKSTGECKPLSKKGQKCSTSSSELSTMFNPGLCPCETGLKCSAGGIFESFFGGSMNGLLGGKTCRSPTSRKYHASVWPFFDEVAGDFDDDEFDDVVKRLV